MFIKQNQKVKTSTHSIKNVHFLREIPGIWRTRHKWKPSTEDANANNAERNRHIHKREVIEVENKLLWK